MSTCSTQACKQFLTVSRSFVRPGSSFDLTRSQSGRTKHVFPSCVYANWYCCPVIKLKRSIFAHKLQVRKFLLWITNAPSQSPTRLRFYASQNLNFCGQLSDDRLLFAALGCVLLGLFWLFLFWFRNNRIHGISISKRTLLHVSDLETESGVT